MNAKEFEKTLETLNGFKSIFSGLFGGRKAKSSFEIYRSARGKGVYDIAVLRSEKHESSRYAIMAFSTGGNIDPETLRIITERANEIPLGTIRYESVGYTKLQRCYGAASFADRHADVASIVDDHDDILVFPAWASSENELDCPFLIYANKDGDEYVYPVPRKRLK
jgi:hypothetical protein